MSAFIPFLWFICITGALVWAFPRVLDALLYYMGKRIDLNNKEVELEERKNEIIKEQIRLQDYQRKQRGK